MKKMDVKIVRNGQKNNRPNPASTLLARASGSFRAVLMRPRLVAAAAFAGFVLFVGTPHAGWDYACRHEMQGIGTCTSASWCAYYGIQGRRIDVPAWGETCDLVKFFRIDWQALWSDLRGEAEGDTTPAILNLQLD